jgi:hypothetical protein
MNLFRKLSIPMVFLAALIPSSCLAQAGEWNAVQQLSSTQQIKVVMDDGKSYHGTLQSATDTALVIHSGSNDQTLSRTNVCFERGGCLPDSLLATRPGDLAFATTVPAG